MDTQSGKRQNSLREWIEEMIFARGLRPGDRIDERQIGQEFGVSRTPVREALLQIEALDLIEIRPRSGAVIKTLSIKEIAAIYEMRAAVEGAIAELAARRMDDADRLKLVALHEETRHLVEAGLKEQYAARNEEFHEAIRRAAANDYLSRLAHMIRRRLQPYRFYQLDRPGDLRRSFDGHQRICGAIFMRDARVAGDAMREHVSGALPFIDLVAEVDPGKPARRVRRAKASPPSAAGPAGAARRRPHRSK